MFKSNRIVPKAAIDTLQLNHRIELESVITDSRISKIEIEKFDNIETNLTKYTAAAPWRQYLFNFLGPVEGKTVLDIACGYSMTPVIFALAGATVYAVDVAPKTIEIVGEFADRKGVGHRMHTHVGPAESLPFEDEKFDLVFGGAALHHFQLDKAAQEIRRVMKKGGRGGFQDPLGHNPLLEFAREYLPYKDKHPEKGTDHPLLINDVHTFGRHFPSYHYRGFDLLTMLAKILHLSPTSGLRKSIFNLDHLVLDKAPFLQRYARFIVTCISR